MESSDFLNKQVLTYIGNKRGLLSFLKEPIELVVKKLNGRKISFFDVFSGSGIVSRFMKQYSHKIIANDLESYSYTLNKCYLTNPNEVNFVKTNKYILDFEELYSKKPYDKGFISKLYAPVNDKKILKDERVFFTTRNANYIDSVIMFLSKIPEPHRTLLMGPFLVEVSKKNNTSGVFKGFYKNSLTKIGQYGGNEEVALKRILGDITLALPFLSNYSCDSIVYQMDSQKLVKELEEVDLAYVDPPYNQHPYGSNYFMLNIINQNSSPKNISNVSGIPKIWNKSVFNQKQNALLAFKELIRNINAKFVLVSYNSDGYLSFEYIYQTLLEYGKVKVYKQDYNTFKGGRNMENRNKYVKEFLFLLSKR